MRKQFYLITLIMMPLFSFQGLAGVISSNADSKISIGSTLTIAGVGLRVDEEGLEEELTAQSPLFLGETLKTKNDSILEINFTDGSVLNLGPKSSISVTQYDYDSNMDFGKIVIRVLRGVYRFRKGRIRSKEPDDIRIDLPSGTVGIRDAIVLGQVVDKRSVIILSGSSLTSIERLVLVRNKAGNKLYERSITEIGYGSVIEDENFAPTPAIKIPPTDIEWLNSQFYPAAKPDASGQAASEEAEAKKNAFTIQAIVHDGGKGLSGKYVVVSGKLYQEEDIVENYKILSISPDFVKSKNLSTGEVEIMKVENAPQKSSRVKAEEKITVDSIYYDAANHQKSFAYINQRLYRESETLLDAQLLEIKPDRVVILRKNAKTPEIYKLPSGKRKTGQKTISLPVIQSIVYDKDPQKRLATVDGKIYREGEWTDENYQLFEIVQDAVWIKRSDSSKPEKVILERTKEIADEIPYLKIQIIVPNAQQPEKSQVAIAGVLYNTGDIVDGYEILEIRKSDIRVRKKGRLSWRTHILKI